eukprot:853561-Prymnesium_polylepis.1
MHGSCSGRVTWHGHTRLAGSGCPDSIVGDAGICRSGLHVTRASPQRVMPSDGLRARRVRPPRRLGATTRMPNLLGRLRNTSRRRGSCSTGSPAAAGSTATGSSPCAAAACS